jgi:hypothetical protein
LIDVRGDFKQVHKGVIAKVDFLGSERFISFGLLAFCFLCNVFLMWSWWQFLIIGITIFGFAIGRVLYISDPSMLEIFIENLKYEETKHRYILSTSNINDIDKKMKKVSVL